MKHCRLLLLIPLFMLFIALQRGYAGNSAPVDTNAPSAVYTEVLSDDYVLMVFIKPIESRMAEFIRWYQDEHIPEVINRPGFVSGCRYSKTGVRGERCRSKINRQG